MRALAAFVRLSRLLFLYGGFAGVALGVAVARHDGWSDTHDAVANSIWVQVMVTAFQLMVHYANDYFDRVGDRNGARTAWSGGSGVLADGILPPRVGLSAALVAAAVGAAAILRFALSGNEAAAVIGVLIGAASWAYSAPPFRFAARGLGELDATLVVAVLVPSASFAALTGRVNGALVGAICATTVAMLAMMLSVEIPDAGSDHGAQKRTLVVRLGVANALNVLTIVASCSLAVTIGIMLGLRSIGDVAILPVLAAGIMLFRLVRGDPRPASVAFWGVALYSTTVTALAIAYAAAPHA